MNKGKQVQIPGSPAGTMMWVDDTREKAPKLRFRPGMVFVYEGEIIMLQAAFRIRGDDREWRYCGTVLSRKTDEAARQQAMERAKSFTTEANSPEVVYWLFRNSLDAFTYFSYLPRLGDGRILSNKQLLQKGERLYSETLQV